MSHTHSRTHKEKVAQRRMKKTLEFDMQQTTIRTSNERNGRTDKRNGNSLFVAHNIWLFKFTIRALNAVETVEQVLQRRRRLLRRRGQSKLIAVDGTLSVWK